MENTIVISFDVEQVAAALGDAGFAVSEKNVAEITKYITTGGEGVGIFAVAFRTLIAGAAAGLKLGRAGRPGVRLRLED